MRKTSIGLAALLLCLLGALTGVPLAASNSDPATAIHFNTKSIDDLRSAINSRDLDRIIEELNDVKRMRYKGEILPYVKALWDEREDVDRSLDWGVVTLPIVKLDLANILIQAIRNGMVDLEMGEFHAFVRDHVTSEDRAVARNALLTLSIVNDPADVPVLLSAAREQNPGTFGAAVVALSGMCGQAASAALDSLEEVFADEGAKIYLGGSRPLDFIRDTREQSAPLREFHGGSCAS